jgi:hypothetical protein
MAGTAFLPWEKWIAQLLHPVYVAIRKWLYKRQRRQDLQGSEGWPEAEGTIHSKRWDSSLPREELHYSYVTKEGYYAGSHWRWFEPSDPHDVKVGDGIVLRYRPGKPEQTVFVRLGRSKYGNQLL